MKRKWYHWTIVLVVVIVAGCAVWMGQHSRNLNHHYVDSTTPTFFFHGSSSSYHAEQYMTNAAKRAGVTKTIVVANVDKHNHVTFRGNIPDGARNPIIEVNHQVQPGHPHNGRPPKNPGSKIPVDDTYVYDVIVAAKRKWHVKTMNIVAHSAGNIDVLYMLMHHANSNNLPKLKKQVAIAAHVNGFIHGGYPSDSKVASNGKPSQESANFTELKPLRKTYPRGVKVLNIYGDLGDGSHSDGLVPVNSARTLRYLVGLRAASYQERKMTGKNARHSRLHHNDRVNKLLIQFLWGK